MLQGKMTNVSKKKKKKEEEERNEKTESVACEN